MDRNIKREPYLTTCIMRNALLCIVYIAKYESIGTDEVEWMLYWKAISSALRDIYNCLA
ncbi:uncharacterized protein PHALS_02935 [Plasmopara halstedii]|uniref:Uncharacterized protein n=1 Tax=Plasmopara halstedii TaxID=4781 RepID=A0A0P1AY89_PLAHL|nr:uncharacterized protein PHALS_02935 [Plasmopara halstedii]CEG46535.1 hypothetical protein PHALS_02935 [Plasmopara halstedii]|eukprot:XP_024582904.1 hypothetical protein PHALS_02935 [Plasmopara halstedii]